MTRVGRSPQKTSVAVLSLAAQGLQHPHFANEISQKLTWGRRCPPQHSVFWLKGDLAIEDTIEYRQDLLLPIEESFSNIFEKTVLALRHILASRNPDFILRTNTSTYINWQALEQTCASLPREGIITGWLAVHRQQVGSSLQDVPFAAGHATLMSRDVAQAIAECNVREYEGFPDDVAMSYVAQASGAHLLCSSRSSVTEGDGLAGSNWFLRVKDYEHPGQTPTRLRLVDQVFHAPSHRLQQQASQQLTTHQLFHAIHFRKGISRVRLVTASFWRLLVSRLA